MFNRVHIAAGIARLFDSLGIFSYLVNSFILCLLINLSAFAMPGEVLRPLAREAQG